MSTVHLYHIAYSEQTLNTVESGYEVLNNLHTNRHDWREYWPIRQFLLHTPLQEHDYYGFFSPRFREKTGLSAAQVRTFVAHAENSDVVSFSPQADMSAFFLNVFEQENTFSPGFIADCETIFNHLGIPIPLQNVVMDARQIIFSNYFVAKPAFWRDWLAFNEQLFAIAESADHPLKALLTYKTTYDAIERKVFLMERTASLLLTLNPKWRIHVHNPFVCAWSAYGPFQPYREEAIICDALKIAYREFAFPEYINTYIKLRNKVLTAKC